MFREMRRSKQELSKEEVTKILDRNTNGILACIGDDEYPYAVPVNYVFLNNKIYFHSAKAGHKLDAILKNPKVSFAVVDQDEIVSEEFTSYFRSVIAFGKARIVEGEEQSEAFWALVEKYSKDEPEDRKKAEIEGCSRAYIIAIDLEHVTGKAAKELV